MSMFNYCLLYLFTNFPRAFSPEAMCHTVINESNRNGISPYVILAVIETESSFRPSVLSDKGAHGLMQVLPQIWNFVRPNDIEANQNDPLVQIEVGTYFLRHLIDQYDGDARRALSHYNAGRRGQSTAGNAYADKVILKAREHQKEHEKLIQEGYKNTQIVN